MSEFPQRIVYVDDDKGMCKIAGEVLEAIDPDIVFVSCPDVAEFLSRRRELQPDLLIMDVSMPDMNGPDTLAALRKDEDADFPVIFLSKKHELVMEDDYKALGVIGVVHKPFDPTDLGDIIRDMWAAHIKENSFY